MVLLSVTETVEILPGSQREKPAENSRLRLSYSMQRVHLRSGGQVPRNPAVADSLSTSSWHPSRCTTDPSGSTAHNPYGISVRRSKQTPGSLAADI